MEGMTIHEVRAEISKVEEIIAVLEWYMSAGRELLVGGQQFINLGDRRVSPASLLSVHADLMAMVGAHRMRIQELGSMRATSAPLEVVDGE